MNRRQFLARIGVLAVLVPAASCTRTEKDTAPMDATEILAAADLAAPLDGAAVEDVPLEGDEQWSKNVAFSGSPDEVDAWVQDSLGNDIESHAYRDGELPFSEKFGPEVPRKGDRVVSATHESVVYLIVVGQEASPTVHVHVHRTGR